jgi:hypothetical protein
MESGIKGLKDFVTMAHSDLDKFDAITEQIGSVEVQKQRMYEIITQYMLALINCAE